MNKSQIKLSEVLASSGIQISELPAKPTIDVTKLIGSDNPLKMPEKMMEILLDKPTREKKFREHLAMNSDLQHDQFAIYFQDHFGERVALKQDFTPEPVAELVAKLTDQSAVRGNGMSYDTCAGTGTLVIQRWWRDLIQYDISEYEPSDYVYTVVEYDQTVIPFLIWNLAIRGMNAIVIHGDTLTRETHGVFFIQNSSNDSMAFSDVNIMPYDDDIADGLDIIWSDEGRYQPHVETSLKDVEWLIGDAEQYA